LDKVNEKIGLSKGIIPFSLYTNYTSAPFTPNITKIKKPFNAIFYISKKKNPNYLSQKGWLIQKKNRTL